MDVVTMESGYEPSWAAPPKAGPMMAAAGTRLCDGGVERCDACGAYDGEPCPTQRA